MEISHHEVILVKFIPNLTRTFIFLGTRIFKAPPCDTSFATINRRIGATYPISSESQDLLTNSVTLELMESIFTGFWTLCDPFVCEQDEFKTAFGPESAAILRRSLDFENHKQELETPNRAAHFPGVRAGNKVCLY